MAKKQKKCGKKSGKEIKPDADGADPPPTINIEEKQQVEDLEKQLNGQGEKSKNSAEAANPTPAGSNMGTLTSTESAKKKSVRGVCAMHKVITKKAQGKKFKIRYSRNGVPFGDSRPTLQSYIGMLARTMVPIDISSWPKVDDDLKAKIWNDIQGTFKVAPESESFILMSAGAKWRQFKSMLTSKYVMPLIGQKKKLARPPGKYAYVGKEAWKRFVAIRTSNDWKTISKEQSERVSQRKYPHRMSRKGYIGLQQQEEDAGRMDPDEDPDRAILWKLGRMTDDEIHEGLAEIYGRIDGLLEKKEKGEFVPSGMEDVLSTALQTPEHSGRVRGVGSFISPSKYFKMPKSRRNQISKAEMLAHDQETKDELEKTKAELARTKKDFMLQIDELKAMMTSFHSPNMSDKASCKGELNELMANNDNINDICITVDPVRPPSPPGNKGPRKCELAVDNIDNKVAFGRVVPGGEVHNIPLKPGHLRVSVDGVIQADALVPVPIVGEIETVRQAVGSYLAWPQDMISFTPTIAKKRKIEVQSSKNPKNELDRLNELFANVNPDKKVPHRFKLLYKHAVTFMKEKGGSIPIVCEPEVFGSEKTIYVLHENVLDLLKFQMIGQAAISTYMAYLFTVVCQGDSDMFAFADPGVTFKLNDDFEAYIVKRMIAAPSRILFLPHNENYHWILVLIWESDIFILNPLHSYKFQALEAALGRAVRSYNAQIGRVNKKPQVKHLLGSPKQPGGHECGYVVMRYMKDIIEDKEMKLISKWAPKSKKMYTEAELDVVRCEALDYMQGFV